VSDSFVIDADELLAPPGVVHHRRTPSAEAADAEHLSPGSWGIASAMDHRLFPRTIRPAAERAIDTIRRATEAVEAYAVEAQQVANTCRDLEREIAELLRHLAAHLDEPAPESELAPVPVGALEA
jgi:hypothetical protein